MCGIVGYLGPKAPVGILVESLRQLEYRGYDSAGVAVAQDGDPIAVYKAAGKLANLEAVLPEALYRQNGQRIKRGIGHIRWATHGAPTQANAHPHQGSTQRVCLVHNGIIENFSELKHELEAEGIVFQSQTDTEVVAHLLEQELTRQPDHSMRKALVQVAKRLEGAYALTVLDQNDPGRLYALRKHAPLVVGLGEGEQFVASDTVALVRYTNRVIYLHDGDIAEITLDGVRITTLDKEETVQPTVEVLNVGPLTIDKKGFKHFMLKEIYEQPDVVRHSLYGRLLGTDEPLALVNNSAFIKGEPPSILPLLQGINRIVIIGCGTSYNAGLVGKYAMEELVRLPVEVEAAGEFRYRNPVLDSRTLLVAISQSGETADTLEALRLAQKAGTPTVAVTNREDSTMAREVDAVLGVRAGVEVSVCATKSFVAQVVVLLLLGMTLAEQRQSADPAVLHNLKHELLTLPTHMEAYLSDTGAVQQLARQYGHVKNMLFIGRGINFPVALEGALKLKEISYIHAEGYSGAELKHGPIALLDTEMPVVATLVPGRLFDKTLSNCQEARAREAQLIAFTPVEASDPRLAHTFQHVLPIPKTSELLSPLVTTIPLQLLAYFMAEYLGKDVDQPRNLAKSVTVE